MAHKKGGGKTKNGRKTIGRRLGVKKFASEYVRAGSIIVRQRGEKKKAGKHVKTGRDHTLFACIDGFVAFHKTRQGCFVSVVPAEG